MIQIVCILLAGCCYAVLSKLTFYNDRDDSSFWGKKSWWRKYRQSAPFLPKKTLYYRLFKIKYREAFPLSTTALVFLTDGYHLVQWFMLKFIFIAVAGGINMTFLYIWASFTVGFNVVFTLIKK